MSEDGVRKFSDTALANFHHPLELLDIIELGDRVKHMDIMSRTKGVFFQLKAAQETDRNVASSLLLRSIGHFNSALTSMPSNRDSLFQCAISWFRYLEINNTNESVTPRSETVRPADKQFSTIQCTVAGIEPTPTLFNLSDPKLHEADRLFHRLLLLDDHDPYTLALCGKFFGSSHKFDMAEECFLQALEANPGCHFARLCYGLFLYFHSDRAAGLKFVNYAPSNYSAFSRINLLGSEWTVRLEIVVTNGSLRYLISPLNISATGVSSRMQKMERMERGVLFEVTKEKQGSEPVPFSMVVAKKMSVRRVKEDELPWFLARKKNSFLYFVNSDVYS